MTKRNAEISIGIIIAAAIGLMVIIIIISLVSGKIGNFSKGIEDTATCKSACKFLGRNPADIGEGECSQATVKTSFLGGDYKDTPNEGCCCFGSLP